MNWFALLLIVSGAAMRLLPHQPNFAPISAIALFGAVYLPNKKTAILIPLLAMLASDVFLGFAEIWVTLSVYGSFLLIGLIGIWLRRHKNIYDILGASLLASSTFFIITNFVVWAATPWYTKNVSGLLECFLLAIPFFKNTILGDLFYVGIFFGSFELVKYIVKRNKLLSRSLNAK